jgi:hypothetical protein
MNPTTSPIVAQFAEKFNPAVPDHVQWLQKVHRCLENMDTVKSDVPSLINSNPMKVKFSPKDMIEWVHVHFTLNFKYAKAVLYGKAFIPESLDIHKV